MGISDMLLIDGLVIHGGIRPKGRCGSREGGLSKLGMARGKPSNSKSRVRVICEALERGTDIGILSFS
jgi:hypothetical protein